MSHLCVHLGGKGLMTATEGKVHLSKRKKCAVGAITSEDKKFYSDRLIITLKTIKGPSQPCPSFCLHPGTRLIKLLEISAKKKLNHQEE